MPVQGGVTQREVHAVGETGIGKRQQVLAVGLPELQPFRPLPIGFGQSGPAPVERPLEDGVIQVGVGHFPDDRIDLRHAHPADISGGVNADRHAVEKLPAKPLEGHSGAADLP